MSPTFKFLIGLVFGFFAGAVFGFKVAKAEEKQYIERYNLECRTNKKTFKLKLELVNFSLRNNIDDLGHFCTTVKALNECAYLKEVYPKERQNALDFWLGGTVSIVYDNNPANKDHCAFVIPLIPKTIFITPNFGSINCGIPSSDFFHETLHGAGFPNHVNGNNEIFEATKICLSRRGILNATANRKRYPTNVGH